MTITNTPAFPEYQAMTLDFQLKGEDGVVHRHTAMLKDDEAGEANTVLKALLTFMQNAGFTWVTAVAFETEGGRVIFSDDNN
jgi:hypothetical protein